MRTGMRAGLVAHADLARSSAPYRDHAIVGQVFAD